MLSLRAGQDTQYSEHQCELITDRKNQISEKINEHFYFCTIILGPTTLRVCSQVLIIDALKVFRF